MSSGVDGGEPLPSLTLNDIKSVAEFLLLLQGLKWFRYGMKTGNLPKLVKKIGKFLAREIIKNPEFLVYAGTGWLGWSAVSGKLEHKLLGGVSGMAAYRMATSGGEIVSGIAAAYLAGLGLWWLAGAAPIEEVKKELGTHVPPECIEEDGRINLDCVLAKMLGF